MKEMDFSLTWVESEGRWLVFTPWNGAKILAGTLAKDGNVWHAYYVAGPLFRSGEDGMSLTMELVEQFLGDSTLNLSAFTSGIRGQGNA